MKGNNIFRVALLSYIILTIGGKELKSTNSGENTGLTFTNQQVNKTVQVCARLLIFFGGCILHRLMSNKHR